MHVPVRNAEREPICPICEAPVEQAGAMCSAICYQHFLSAVAEQAGILDMENYLDMVDQPWYGDTQIEGE